MNNIPMYDFWTHKDDRGNLVVLEEGKGLPFLPKRMYYIYNVAEATARGFHAHRALNQLCIAVSGSVSMLMDDGKSKQTVRLDAPDKGLFVGPMIWHEMFDFSADCVLVVLADNVYDESDYIRDYEEFLHLCK